MPHAQPFNSDTESEPADGKIVMPTNARPAMVAVPAAELSRLQQVDELARAFLSEWDNPTPDYAYRVSLKQRLRDLTK